METINQARLETSPGTPFPYGVSPSADGINFSIFSKQAKEVFLCLFGDDLNTPFSEIKLDPKFNRTGDVWHIHLKEVPKDTSYGYKIIGPDNPDNLILLDPYAKAVTSSNVWGQNLVVEPDKKPPYHPRGVVFSEQNFDWEGINNPNIPMNELIIYEMHVRGFTKHESSGVKNKGTFLGIIEKIPHLLELGVNAIELLPVHEFNEMEIPRYNPVTRQLLYNYWGYSPVNFFSLMNRYAVDANQGHVIQEFKTMVKELHRNGIEVILDVVYNHTSESTGMINSFQGIDKKTYYSLDGESKFLNFSGCGNTFSCNQPVVRKFIRDSLRYLVTELHVDGFRFDLASVMTRDRFGTPLPNPPLIESLTYDPILANTKLIAEPWDVGGLYQVGGFYLHSKWSEWNGKYRDAVRKFIKGTDHEKQHVATRICGSQDFYGNGKFPTNSINFVIAHDGFTLRDLVSYNQKHNIENGEDNRDGLNENDSWNCGTEGTSRNKKVNDLREQQMRNFHLMLMVSQGVPMIHMGDEYGHTRKGNNNAWCQDNDLNWFLWDKLKENQSFYRFYQKLIHFRKKHSILHRSEFLTQNDIEWHGLEAGKPNWGGDDRFMAFTLKDHEKHEDLYIAFNASFHQIALGLPIPPEGKKWHCIVDTHKHSPEDFKDEEKAIPIAAMQYKLAAYSSIMLKAR